MANCKKTEASEVVVYSLKWSESKEKWQLFKGEGTRSISNCDTKDKALVEAKDHCKNQEARLIVYKKDGTEEKKFNFSK